LLQATRSVPIVFAQIVDPVGSGLVASLARPGGNITGFTVFEFGMSGKWVELLKEIAPGVKRVAVLRDVGGIVVRAGIEPGRDERRRRDSSALSPHLRAPRTAV
jgi:hypothetical protein